MKKEQLKAKIRLLESATDHLLSDIDELVHNPYSVKSEMIKAESRLRVAVSDAITANNGKHTFDGMIKLVEALNPEPQKFEHQTT